MSDPQFPAPGGAQPLGSIPPVPRAPAPPPGAYGVPVGGYQLPVGDYQVPPAAPRAPRTTGLLAMLGAFLAAVVAPAAAGLIALRAGLRVFIDNVLSPTGELSLAALSPVRTQVLWVEILFWAATVIGILALVLGIIATARGRGRGMGITAIVLAALGPFAFVLLVTLLFGVGNGIGFPGSF